MQACVALLSGGLALTYSTDPRAYAADFHCENGFAYITGSVPRDQALICEAAERTAVFLVSIGIPFEKKVEIEIVDQGLLNRSETIGCFDWETDRISLLSSEQCSASGGLNSHGSAEANEIYIGFVAHEISHAISKHAFSVADPSVTTQEYIAAVVQVSVMDPAERNRLLEKLVGNGFNEISEVTLLAYQIDPAQFAVEAYRHFKKPGNGTAFVGALLSGAIVLQDHLPYGY